MWSSCAVVGRRRSGALAHDERTAVCNLTVRGLHTFAVGRGQVLVHNASGSYENAGQRTSSSLSATKRPLELAPNPLC